MSVRGSDCASVQLLILIAIEIATGGGKSKKGECLGRERRRRHLNNFHFSRDTRARLR